MALETGNFIGDLVSTNPLGSDGKSLGDDHIRLLKSTLQGTFPGMIGAAWRVQSKPSAYTVVPNDNMTVIEGTAALTLSLTAAATLGNKHLFIVVANGGIVTVDPNAAETINEVATLIIPDGGQALIFCDGAKFFALLSPILNESEGAPVASAASPDIWTRDGDTRHLTGSVTITGFAAASRPGIWQKLIIDAAPLFTDGANLIVEGNVDFQASVGDIAYIYAETITQFRVFFKKADGTAVSSEFTSGTVMLFHQAAAPTGWTKDVAATLDNSALRVVTSTAFVSGKQGATAFTSVFGSGKTAGDYTLAIADIPSHNHTTSNMGADATLGNYIDQASVGSKAMNSDALAAAGGGGAHNHTLSLDLNYINMIIASKD